ncbi:MAG: hypothetical protein WC880_02195 [Candidatus Paceibacterota bacterium]
MFDLFGIRKRMAREKELYLEELAAVENSATQVNEKTDTQWSTVNQLDGLK